MQRHTPGALAALFVLLPALAFAQDHEPDAPAEPTDEAETPVEAADEPETLDEPSIVETDPRRHAVEMSRAAQEAYAEGDIARAIVLFEQAFDYAPDPAFAMNLAQLYDAEGQLPQAMEYYEAYLALFDDAPDRDDILMIIEEIQAELDAEWSLVTVTSVPSEATVSVVYGDEVFFLGQTPYLRYLEPEPLLFRVEADGYEIGDIPVIPLAGQPVDYEVVLVPLPEPPPPPVNRRGRLATYLLAGGAAAAVGGVALWSSADEGATTQSVGLGLAGIGVAGILGGVVILATAGDDDEGEPAEAALAPILTPTTIGLQLGGRF